MTRPITHRYVDPLSQIWLRCAERVGLRVVRSPDAYASTDGAGTMVIGADDTLDPDDSLAQMIFHELCHSLIQGEDSFAVRDWGLDNESLRDVWRENACLRLQAVLAGRHGLRRLFAPTTDSRTAFWDHLPADPLADRTSVEVQHALLGLARAEKPPWAPALGEALAATATLAALASPGAPADSLWSVVDPVPAPHPTGLPGGVADGRTCGTCAWNGKRCLQAKQKVDPAWPGCERWEPSLDCQTCGACCRAAYHAVEVGRRDPAVKKQPDFIVDLGTRLELRRAGDRCAALEGDTTTRFRCVIYDDRPRTCRDFTLGSEHCLTARRRVGLSR